MAAAQKTNHKKQTKAQMGTRSTRPKSQPTAKPDIWHRLGRWAIIIAGILLLLSIIAYAAFQLSPWPKALVIRHLFDQGGAKTSQALQKYVPADVASSDTLQYREGDKDAQLQAFYPQSVRQTQKVLPTVVWIHGGAWISGSTKNISNYLKIVASHGYTVIGINYSLAPGSHYPKPIVQGNAALQYIQDHAKELHADSNQIILAGDSAGSQIAAQIAALTTDEAYAKELGVQPTLAASKLKGTVLNCGAYDLALADYNGASGDFLRTVLWSYSGSKNFLDDPNLKLASVARYVTSSYPPTFITAGNIDPLEPQSHAMAQQLIKKGVYVDALFYPSDHKPQLPHEYQFNLDSQDGKNALNRILSFLSTHVQYTKP